MAETSKNKTGREHLERTDGFVYATRNAIEDGMGALDLKLDDFKQTYYDVMSAGDYENAKHDEELFKAADDMFDFKLFKGTDRRKAHKWTCIDTCNSVWGKYVFPERAKIANRDGIADDKEDKDEKEDEEEEEEEDEEGENLNDYDSDMDTEDLFGGGTSCNVEKAKTSTDEEKEKIKEEIAKQPQLKDEKCRPIFVFVDVAKEGNRKYIHELHRIVNVDDITVRWMRDNIRLDKTYNVFPFKTMEVAKKYVIHHKNLMKCITKTRHFIAAQEKKKQNNNNNN